MGDPTDRFRPSNSSAGYGFMSQWCDQCRKHRAGRCGILARTMSYDITDPEYPAEWRVGEHGAGECTAFVDRAAKVLVKHRNNGTDELFTERPNA